MQQTDVVGVNTGRHFWLYKGQSDGLTAGISYRRHRFISQDAGSKTFRSLLALKTYCLFCH